MSKEQSDVTDDGISIGEIAEKLSTTSFWLSIVSFLSQISEQIKSALNRIFGDSIHRLTTGIKSTRELFYIFLYSRIIRAPAFILIILLISAGWMGNSAKDFQQQINGDVEVYLPDGANSTDLLLEVREQWSTDIVLLYIHTNNAIEDVSSRGTENVTDVDILTQISWIEGDDMNSNAGGYKHGLDRNKSDRGVEDGVVWILSPAQVIKEANSSAKRFNCAMEKYQIPNLDPSQCPLTEQTPYDGYSIPDDQRIIDDFVDTAGPLLSNFVRDTNGDNIWDTAVVVVGIRFDMDGTDISPRNDPKGKTEENPSGLIQDHRAFIEHTQELLEQCGLPLCTRSYTQPLSSINETRMNLILPRDAITVTGLTPVLHDVSDAVYEELVTKMLPLSAVFVIITMVLLHRSPKVVIICGTPILFSLLITFGATVLLDIELTPMIISAGPILVGLGVDYALHLTNRIEENRDDILDEYAQKVWDAERDGRQIESLDPWDEELYLKATVAAAETSGHAIMLSALTTIIGFSVLTWTELVPIRPMRTVGTTLLLGIFITFILSLIMVPALAFILRYRKGRSSATDNLWSKIGQIPLRWTWTVLIVSMLVTAFGVYYLEEELGKDITGASSEVPPGLVTYEALAEYSRVFEGGQTNMFIVDATDRGRMNDTAPIRDLPVLDAIERIQVEDIDTVDNTTSISLVTILKSIPVSIPNPITTDEIYSDTLWGILHSECWENPTAGPECPFFQLTSRDTMVNVAFDTLSPEVRSMLMNADSGFGETKTLVYVNQPYISLGDAGLLRETIDQRLTGENCVDGDAKRCTAVGMNGVENTLLTGGLPVSLDINSGIHEAQSETTIATMIVLLFVMSILFASPRLATFTMIAVGAVVLWQPLLMKLGGGVNVNVFTAMIGTIVFGIGVDDSIHIVDRIKDEKETPIGVSKAVEKTGQTIFETTATTSAGLAAGLFVAIPGLRNFFVLMMLLIILALFTSSILLPSMLVATKRTMHRIKGLPGSWVDDDRIIVEDSGPIDATIMDSN
ncbi:MAG: RND family transporter [Candidatus Thalassarchaeaceae archaeon]|nr:MAG: hypothetical protein CMA04_000345 [Euryarchaeota archaeon]RPG76675.1 MAG: hypothetical protein CBC45_000030 [Euryarchaeota archaeon TMED85]|tara:strand:- start:2257 stop:5337 length:3081 start_codon:yes stop_codon:yes gene_type:complete